VVLSSWIADYKEMAKLALIFSMRCGTCTAPPDNMNDLVAYPNRSEAEATTLREAGLSLKEQQDTGYHDVPVSN